MTLALPATTEPAPPITPEERERCSISSSGATKRGRLRRLA